MYAPNFAQTPFWETICKELLLDLESEVLLLGDFNTVLDKHKDRPKVSSTPIIPGNFLYYKKMLGLVDIWRVANEDKRDYTFYSHQHTTYSSIDFVFTSENLSHKIDSPQIGLRTLLDHAPMLVILRVSSGTRRSLLWRLNNYLLESPGLQEYIEKEIQALFAINDGSTRACLV